MERKGTQLQIGPVEESFPSATFLPSTGWLSPMVDKNGSYHIFCPETILISNIRNEKNLDLYQLRIVQLLLLVTVSLST
jgi:hypothetical protein